jgi:hypothetical protein
MAASQNSLAITSGDLVDLVSSGSATTWSGRYIVHVPIGNRTPRLSEQCDDKLLRDLTSKFTVHASFVAERNHLFRITGNHYAGSASYDVTHFVEKDSDGAPYQSPNAQYDLEGHRIEVYGIPVTKDPWNRMGATTMDMTQHPPTVR